MANELAAQWLSRAVVRKALGKASRAVYLPSQNVAAGACRLSIPNLITLARILLVPVVVWAIASNQMLFAFLLFAAAGVSDAVDGFLAKRFGMASELGAYLDPLADKVLIVSIYVSLGIVDALPRWLVILVVSRDLLIVGGVMFSWIVNKPVGVKPHHGLEGQHGGAALAGRAGARLARLRLRCRLGAAADDGDGRRADARLDRGLLARMGSPHGRQWRAALIAPLREPYARVRAGENRGMTLTRQMTFWVLTFVVGVLVLYLLREILLPFVAGMALAYLLDPLANRLERMGVNRLAATLVIIGAVVLAFVILHSAVRADPDGAARRLHREAAGLRVAAAGAGDRADPRMAAQASLGEGVADAQVSDLVKQGAGWITALPQVAVVGRAGADLDLLARGRDAGGRVLSALRLEPDGRDGRPAGSRCSIARPCTGSRARWTRRLPASCAGRRRSA